MNIKKTIKRISIILITLLLIVSGFILYITNTSTTDKCTLAFYKELKIKLKEKGYQPKVYILCAKRPKWYNTLLVNLSNGAAPKSRHLKGEAIDILVLDINNDGTSNTNDVNIVHHILDAEIVKSNGGLGTYKSLNGFLSQQMVHFDCRGYKARWNK